MILSSVFCFEAGCAHPGLCRFKLRNGVRPDGIGLSARLDRQCVRTLGAASDDLVYLSSTLMNGCFTTRQGKAIGWLDAGGETRLLAQLLGRIGFEERIPRTHSRPRSSRLGAFAVKVPGPF